MRQKETKWIFRWKNWLAPTTAPGVWKRKEGGHLVRARVVDPTTAAKREIKKVLPEADLLEAVRWLEQEKRRIRAGLVQAPRPKQRFCDFAVSLLETKIRTREIISPKGKQKWENVLAHLIGGTDGTSARKHVNGFGEMFVDKITAAHVEAWREEISDLIAAGDYAPTTCNAWLAILQVIMKAAKRQFRLTDLATDGVKKFDTSEHHTYTDEEPNALLPAEVPAFMEKMRELFPQFFAMFVLGLVTGLRPSTLRALRRCGPEADVLWEQRRLLVRRSQTIGDPIRTTKNKRRYAVDLPDEVMSVLKWHVDTQLRTPEQQESELLFPAVNGKFRSPSVLNAPLADVSNELGLGKKFTQRGLRRTYNDLARAVNVNGLVVRSISGHLTESMQHHYSSVSPDEQRASIAKVFSLAQARARREGDGEASSDAGGGAPGGAPSPEHHQKSERAG